MDEKTDSSAKNSIETKIVEYVAWAQTQADRIAEGKNDARDLRALIYQAQHYRLQAGVLAEAANFIGDEAERALQAFGEAEDSKLGTFVESFFQGLGGFASAIEACDAHRAQVRQGAKTDPPGPLWEPQAEPPTHTRPSVPASQEATGPAPSEAPPHEP